MLMILEPEIQIDPLTPEDHERLIGRLGNLFDEFFKYRRENGVTKLFYDYACWLRRKRWYEGPLRKKNKPTS
jgi:hypothetical protein